VSTLARDTVRGMAVGATLLGGVTALQAVRAEVDLAGVIQPILVFALIGLTVGALAGPLVSRAIRRRRRSRPAPRRP